MTNQDLYNNCQKLLEYTKNKLKQFDGYYYVDYRTIKDVCGANADAVFLHIGNSDIARFMDDTKGIKIKCDAINPKDY